MEPPDMEIDGDASSVDTSGGPSHQRPRAVNWCGRRYLSNRYHGIPGACNSALASRALKEMDNPLVHTSAVTKPAFSIKSGRVIQKSAWRLCADARRWRREVKSDCGTANSTKQEQEGNASNSIAHGSGGAAQAKRSEAKQAPTKSIATAPVQTSPFATLEDNEAGASKGNKKVEVNSKATSRKTHPSRPRRRKMPKSVGQSERGSHGRQSHSDGVTIDEEETMFFWSSKNIHLLEPPKYINETHMLAEPLALRQTHKQYMGYKLYVVAPFKLKWPAKTANYHFCETLLRKNQDGAGPSDRVLELIHHVHLFTSFAESRLAVLRFRSTRAA